MDEDVGEGIGGKLDFLEYFSALPDPRQSKKVLYPLDEVLFLMLCAVLCGADGWVSVALFGRCWLITYPLAGWLGARMGMGPTFAVLALIAAASVALASAVWPAAEEKPVPHRHDDLPLGHPHLPEGNYARGHAHPAIVDDLHPQWSKLA